MHTIPLLSHTDPDQIVAWHCNEAVTVRQFLADISQLAANLPDAKYMLNMCSDRYHFAVGLAAAMVRKTISLLPPSHTSESVTELQRFAPDVFCLGDNDQPGINLPLVRYPDTPAPPLTASCLVPQIPGRQCVAVMFTSGSTGTPQPHAKTWEMLSYSVRAEAERLGLTDQIQHTLIGTVPPQHMYGLESTIVMAWQSGNAFSHSQPFYPADICQAIAAAPAPCVLISTPIHLRTLLDSGLQPPPLALMVSATAPLSNTLAHALETRFQAPLLEIYGSTETGITATRRVTQNAEWQLLPGITLHKEGAQIRASSKYITPPITLSDIIEIVSKDRFLLLGRTADLINIAGKRNSLANLNHQLNAIPGVIDGVFFMPDETCFDHVTRLAAFVVAPDLDAPRLLMALRERMDAVFLPRPLLFLDTLPRNATGKLPRAALQALLLANT